MHGAGGDDLVRDPAQRFHKRGDTMHAENIGKRILSWVLIVLFAIPSGAFAQSSGPPTRFTQEELDQMLAPIALYPDSLLAQMLMAATYPVEVVEADRWARNNKSPKGEQFSAALDKQKWDLSVKALVPFPQILAMMSEKLDWTQRLGDAFLDQQAEVMDTIQQLRSKAYAQGSLKNTSEQKVIVEQQVIRVEPANPQVIYIPTYNPMVVYGSWWYPYYPPYAWYPAGAVVATGMLSFAAGVAVGAAWNSGWGSWNWGGRQVNANINRNVNINSSNINVSNIQTSKWQHEAVHRRGDPYRSQDLRDRYGQAGKGDAANRSDFRGFDQSATDKLGQGAGRQGLDQRRGDGGLDRQALDQRKDLNRPDRPAPDQRRDLQQPGGQGFQDRKASGAFQGIERGDNTQKFSDRGRTSRQNAGSVRAGGGGGGGGRGRR